MLWGHAYIALEHLSTTRITQTWKHFMLHIWNMLQFFKILWWESETHTPKQQNTAKSIVAVKRKKQPAICLSSRLSPQGKATCFQSIGIPIQLGQNTGLIQNQYRKYSIAEKNENLTNMNFVYWMVSYLDNGCSLSLFNGFQTGEETLLIGGTILQTCYFYRQ